MPDQPRSEAIHRDVVIRAIGRWEDARAAAWDAWQAKVGPGVRGIVEYDARQLEAILGDVILQYVAGEPGGGVYEGHRQLSAAVRHAGVLYVVACDPTEALNDQAGGSEPWPIVVRLRDDRTAEL